MTDCTDPSSSWASPSKTSAVIHWTLTLSPPTTRGSLVQLQHALGETLDGDFAVILDDLDPDVAATRLVAGLGDGTGAHKWVDYCSRWGFFQQGMDYADR